MKNTSNLHLIQQLDELAKIRKQLRQLKSSKLSLIDPNSGQGKALSILKSQPSITQRDLVNELNMRPQSASEIIQKLDKKEMIYRHKSETDKRILQIELTEKGQRASQRLSLNETEHMDVLTEDEKEELSLVLDKLIDSFEAENTKAGKNFGVNLFGERKKK
ncbi:MarR family winged helix-turn-helix transcriptional regulator [Pediococcus argentinicus]|nr:MarR family transcriptional regulator [Pediococcus argentinicus]NKZ22601.1 MarR family transcriptional regulator [Pediococcus argentinicus]GEP19740.1 hypothetical protein LSA03_11240 [Pediococcus argentinicus]